MATSLVPPLNTRGLYTLRDPWVTDLTRLFTCVAIERFSALAARNVNVYEQYYRPKGLSQDIYAADAAAGIVIVTLASDTTAPISLPSSYIVSYPNLASVSYNHVVLSVSLGELFDGIVLDGVQEQIATAVSSVIGVVPKVLVHIAPTKNVITPQEHEAIEAARNAAITNRTTNASQIREKDAQIKLLQDQNATLTAIALQNGWIGQSN